MVCSERPPNGAPQHIVKFAQNGIRPAMLIETHPRSALAFGSFGREGLCSSCTHPEVAHLAVNASKTRINMLSLMGHFCRWWVLTECTHFPFRKVVLEQQQLGVRTPKLAFLRPHLKAHSQVRWTRTGPSIIYQYQSLCTLSTSSLIRLPA